MTTLATRRGSQAAAWLLGIREASVVGTVALGEALVIIARWRASSPFS